MVLHCLLVSVSWFTCNGLDMTNKEIVTKLTMLKLEYGDGNIPMAIDLDFKVENKELIETIAHLCVNKYLIHDYEYVEDDEGIRHKYKVLALKLSNKANKLLKEASK